MIHPRMATMLSVVLTDATVAPEVLWGLLRPAAARTWDQLSVDGDTSTNDTVFVLASGASGAAPVGAGTDGRRRPRRRDRGDRARPRAPAGGRRRGRQRRSSRPSVTGARDDAEARAVARAVVSSSLVKAAAHGRDPNWGRIAGAAGNARLADAAVLEAAGLSRRRGGGPCRHPGRARPATGCGSRSPATSCSTAPRAARSPSIAPRRAPAMERPEVVIALDLGLGDGRGEAFGCDLTEAYVIENSEYTT